MGFVQYLEETFIGVSNLVLFLYVALTNETSDSEKEILKLIVFHNKQFF